MSRIYFPFPFVPPHPVSPHPSPVLRIYNHPQVSLAQCQGSSSFHLVLSPSVPRIYSPRPQCHPSPCAQDSSPPSALSPQCPGFTPLSPVIPHPSAWYCHPHRSAQDLPPTPVPWIYSPVLWFYSLPQCPGFTPHPSARIHSPSQCPGFTPPVISPQCPGLNPPC